MLIGMIVVTYSYKYAKNYLHGDVKLVIAVSSKPKYLYSSCGIPMTMRLSISGRVRGKIKFKIWNDRHKHFQTNL